MILPLIVIIEIIKMKTNTHKPVKFGYVNAGCVSGSDRDELSVQMSVWAAWQCVGDSGKEFPARLNLPLCAMPLPLSAPCTAPSLSLFVDSFHCGSSRRGGKLLAIAE